MDHLTDLQPEVLALRAIETEAAALSRHLAADLRRPRAQRDSDPAAVERLQQLLRQAQETAMLLRHRLGRRHPPRSSPAFAAAQYARQLRTRFRLWSQTLAAVRQVGRARTWPVMPRRRPILDLGGVEDGLTDRVFTLMHRAINPAEQSQSAADLGCWPDIPTNVALFVAQAHLAYRVLLAQRRDAPTRFIDIGCGGGTKVILGAQMFSRADGLEYDPAYAAAARRVMDLLDARRCRIIEGDALVFDDYGAYDVLYMYRPIRDPDRLIELETRVLALARPGAVLIAPYDSFAPRTKRPFQIGQGVFVLGIERGEALRRAVLAIGPHIANLDWPPPPETDWLLPLWQACEANGISPAAYG
jgi:SAM-dependent methyltransferase